MEFKTINEIAKINSENISKNYNEDYIMYLDTANITNGKIEDIVKINTVEAPSRAKRIVRKNDIIYSTVRPNLCHYGILRNITDNMIVSTGFAVIRCDETKVLPEYLYAYLTLPNITEKFHAIAETSTSAYPSIKPSDLGNLVIPIPSLNVQSKIAKILYNIDRKIELNNQINDNLYELGDTLYKELYSKYEDDLPKGYKSLNLNEVSVNFDSKRKPMSSREREQHKGIYPYYGATSIIDYVDNYIFDDTYLLMGEDGTVKTNEGYPVLQYIWGKNWINNHAHVLQGTIISTEHLMFALRKKRIEALITGAVQPKINQENMNNIKIILADEENNQKFESIINSIMKQYKNNIEENNRLGQLRDTLLPKLINGEINLDKIDIRNEV